MWTNYYIRNNICSHCDRYDEEHLGKSSSWRDFTIHHNKDRYNSFNEFKKYIKWKKIFNEYDEEISYDDFIKLIKDKRKQNPYKHKWLTHWIYIDWYYFLEWNFN